MFPGPVANTCMAVVALTQMSEYGYRTLLEVVRAACHAAGSFPSDRSWCPVIPPPALPCALSQPHVPLPVALRCAIGARVARVGCEITIQDHSPMIRPSSAEPLSGSSLDGRDSNIECGYCRGIVKDREKSVGQIFSCLLAIVGIVIAFVVGGAGLAIGGTAIGIPVLVIAVVFGVVFGLVGKVIGALFGR